MNIVLVYSPVPRQVREWHLTLPDGATVAEAIAASGIRLEFPALESVRLAAGVWGKKAGLTHKLQARDRVEIYRPLRVDPKVARRERFTRQGVKKSGLFANRRTGAKAGY